MHIASNIVYCVNVESIFLRIALRIGVSLEDRGTIYGTKEKMFPARASYFAISGGCIFCFASKSALIYSWDNGTSRQSNKFVSAEIARCEPTQLSRQSVVHKHL